MTEKFDPGTFETFSGLKLLCRRPPEDGNRVLKPIQSQNAVQPDPDVLFGKLEVVLSGVDLDPHREVALLLQKHGPDGVVEASVDVGVDEADPETIC